MKIAFTGHRPNKLGWGYNYTENHWVKLKDVVRDQLIKLHATDVYTGMALGVDTVAALVVLELNHEGYDIKLHAVIPCANQCNMWKNDSKDLYYYILSYADEIVGMLDHGAGCESLFIYIRPTISSVQYMLLKNRGDFNTKFFNELHKGMHKDTIYAQEYEPWLMQKRNEFMVDNCDTLISIWDGSSGGTGNCVAYATKKNKDIIRIDPNTI